MSTAPEAHTGGPRIGAIRPAGTRALLVELGSLADVVALHAQLQARPLPGQVDALAAAGTVLVRFAGRSETVAAVGLLEHLDFSHAELPDARTVSIDTVYDGEDLAEVARLTGLSEEAVINAHTGTAWTGGFGGFAPGFTYLVGGDPALNVPRRSTPRKAVPTGSVALAGDYSAIYPRTSPGGWQLIGRTNAKLWDLSRESPALIRPGDSVIFQAVRELVTTSSISQAEAPPTQGDHPSLEVKASGLQSLVQDLGRPGYADLGVSVAGAADTRSARQANRLVGNPADAAVIENLFGGLELTAHGDTVLALSGAETPAAIVSPGGDRGRPAPLNRPFALLDGETLNLGAPYRGVRTYLAVRGGLAVDPVLGSRSTDTMSGIGPAPLDAGTRLPVGDVPGVAPVGTAEPSPLPEGTAPGALGDGRTPTLLRITAGPRQDWFGPDAATALTAHTWLATNESNRIGVRLATDPADPDAAPLERARDGELPSEGVVAGSLQVPPSGLPVLFLADHPVTGGYPVIAVVVPQDLPVAAQLPPGHPVRFVFSNPDTLAPLSAEETAGLFTEGTP